MPQGTSGRRNRHPLFILEIGLAKSVSRSVVEQDAPCNGGRSINRHGRAKVRQPDLGEPGILFSRQKFQLAPPIA
jgi:hypothetical protein